METGSNSVCTSARRALAMLVLLGGGILETLPAAAQQASYTDD